MYSFGSSFNTFDDWYDSRSVVRLDAVLTPKALELDVTCTIETCQVTAVRDSAMITET